MDLLRDLVNAINTYDESEEASTKLRNLVCYISDKKKYRNDPLFRSLLFSAAQVMRVFGYNVQNDIKLDDICSSNGLDDIRHQAIHNYYTSKAFSNNLIDRRQKEIIDRFESINPKRLLVSAPTSFGKTFILREILYLNKDRYNNILLVFPTVALLNENTIAINDLNKQLNLDYSIINNVYSQTDKNTRSIYILTPERTLQLLAANETLDIDFFFFDEVYKIDEDLNQDENTKESSEDTANKNNRAKAFRIALYLLSKKVPEYYIAGPYLNLDFVKPGFKKYLETNEISIKQIDFEPTMRIEVDAWNKNGQEIDPIRGETKIKFTYAGSAQDTKAKIKGLISYLEENDLGQAILYCAFPGRTMTYANSIISELDPSELILEKHKSFIQHLQRRYGVKYSQDGKELVSSDYWSLIKILSAGYGVHHGKFPKYIQREMLNIFNRGDIKYLFCTSTIIEGVNTTAQNVIIINNQLGSGMMTAFALKNIRGRAGRYYHHFIGRVFYTDKKQREIEENDMMRLNFSIYDDKKITDVDCDNAELSDLMTTNRKIKRDREESFHKTLLPDEVFYKNRLFPRDIQEKYLDHILEKINEFIPLIHKPGNIQFFLRHNYLGTILTSFSEVEIIPENTAKVYSAISNMYSNEHFQGLMKFQLDKKIKNPFEDIDKAYLTVFTQIRNDIEYNIPRLLSLFESLFIQACVLNNTDVENFTMSSIIRYFELGVKTVFGIYLVEYGFPADAIRDIEDKLPELSAKTLQESTNFVRSNLTKLRRNLDQYEIELLERAINSAQ
ncbi:MAG: DEAD/DEAH box helicase [Candidatus Hodarchaeales archaeon]